MLLPSVEFFATHRQRAAIDTVFLTSHLCTRKRYVFCVQITSIHAHTQYNHKTAVEKAYYSLNQPCIKTGPHETVSFGRQGNRYQCVCTVTKNSYKKQIHLLELYRRHLGENAVEHLARLHANNYMFGRPKRSKKISGH
jgi:hypothetical protein